MNFIKNFNNIYICGIIILLLVQTLHAQKIEKKILFKPRKYGNAKKEPIELLNNSKNDINNENDKNDKFYMIFVNTPSTEEGGFSNGLTKRQDFINSMVNEIHNLIVDNRDSYQNPSKLDEMENQNRQLKKRDSQIQILSEESDSSFVYPISSTKNKAVLYAYLTPELAKKIEANPNVISCESPKPLKLAAANFNGRDMQLETGWSNINILTQADLHLSLISQGIFDSNIVHKYDTNYYFPSTAGEGVDIFIMDSGFDFNNQEFSNKRERSVQCGFNITEAKVLSMPSTTRCFAHIPIDHGSEVADIAAGRYHGVANKANIYGFTFNDVHTFYVSDLFAAVEYVKKNLFTPHRAVFNFSLGDYYPIHNQEQSLIYFQELVNELSEAGAVFVAAAGNESRNSFDEEKGIAFYPCAFDNIICVGAIDNVGSNFNANITYSELDTNVMKTKHYNRVDWSNFGPKVDIYAPGFVYVVFREGESRLLVGGYDSGTSFSSPIVAGIAATIISEHSDVKFTSAVMLDYLYRFAEKDRIGNLDDREDKNIFVNNGKRIVYSSDNRYNGCGIRAGKQGCANGCCTLDGQCSTDIGKCRTDQGCQVNYGYYFTVFSPELGRCGYGYGSCPYGSCCSAQGYCGSTSDYCDVGCQEDYGFCKKKYIILQ